MAPPNHRRSRIAVSPRARRVIRRHGIDLAAVRGTGPGGRILEADVLEAIRRQADLPEATPPAAGISAMRRAVAAKVSASFATVPHFYLQAVADVTELVDMRQKVADGFQRRCGARLSVTDLLLRATALALRESPQANRIWQQETIVPLASIDVGLVVRVADGLMVPIVHRADRLQLADLVRTRAALVEGARAGRLPADALQGGATALSNLGRHRVDQFAAIINPPHSTMLGVGQVAPRAAVFEGRLAVRQTVHLTLSVDHRVMDGEPAAEFLDRIVQHLETPLTLLDEGAAE